MKCNYFKKNEPLFSTTNEYILNKMQHRISQTIDYSSTAFGNVCKYYPKVYIFNTYN